MAQYRSDPVKYKRSPELLSSVNTDSDGEDNLGFSENSMLEFDEEPEIESGTDTLLLQFWRKYQNYFNSRTTLDYNYTYQFGDPKRTVENLASLRLEMERFFANHYYGKIDLKVEARLPDDHLARAKKASILIDSDLQQGYIESSFENLTIKAGKQTLIWGESDTAVITDLVSPRDRTELYFKDLEDSRVGQVMLTGIYYNKHGAFQCFLNPDPAVDKFPKPGSEYFVTVPKPDVEKVTEDKPSPGEMEYGFRWKKTLGQSDISLMVAELIENEPIIVFQDFSDSGKMRLEKKYKRFRMAGFAGSLSSGNFIWKAETAYCWNRSYQYEGYRSKWSAASHDTINTAIATEFSSPSKLWNLSIEIANKHILEFNDRLKAQKQNEPAATFILSHKCLDENLKIDYTIISQLNTWDTFQKLRGEYKLTDSLTGTLEVGGFTSQDKDGMFWNYRNKHRILAGLKFQI